MNHDYWASRWAEGRIGFHEGTPNTLLSAHRVVLGEHRRVLVPLCGKSEDLAFLASHGHEVVGVELVEAGARAFFTEHKLTPVEAKRGAGLSLSAQGIEIIVGDFFATTRDDVGPIRAFFDRAALIALPPTLRGRYVAHLRGLFAGEAQGLVVNLEYDQALMEGPPFSVPEAEVRTHYAGADLAVLTTRPVVDNARLKAATANATETCFSVRLR